MKDIRLADLQESVQDRTAFGTLADYLTLGGAFLKFILKAKPTRIVSPSHPNYVFYQCAREAGHP